MGLNIMTKTHNVYKVCRWIRFMKQYSRFQSDKLKRIYDGLSGKDRLSLDTFLKECSTTANQNKVKDIKRCILQFLHICNKEIKDINHDSLVKYLNLLNSSSLEEWTKHDLKAHNKRFLKWYFEDWNKRFKEFKIMRNGKSIGINQRKINPNTLLSKEDIETIMKKENDFLLKAFFISMYESGMRPSELRKLKWNNIKLDIDEDHLTEVSVFMTKNQQHKTIYVKQATPYLKKLLENSQSEYIFPSKEDKNKPISDNTATRWINILGKHIDKHIYPYLIRHTRSQELYDLVDEGKLSDNVATKLLGHSKSMRSIYQQLSTKTIKEAITKSVFNIEELPPEQQNELKKQLEAQDKRLKAIEDLLTASAVGKTKISDEERGKIKETIGKILKNG